MNSKHITRSISPLGKDFEITVIIDTTDTKIDARQLFHQSKTLNDIIMTSELSNVNKLMLQKFSTTLVQDNTTVKSLRYEKQDLERVLSNITDI